MSAANPNLASYRSAVAGVLDRSLDRRQVGIGGFLSGQEEDAQRERRQIGVIPPAAIGELRGGQDIERRLLAARLRKTGQNRQQGINGLQCAAPVPASVLLPKQPLPSLLQRLRNREMTPVAPHGMSGYRRHHDVRIDRHPARPIPMPVRLLLRHQPEQRPARALGTRGDVRQRLQRHGRVQHVARIPRHRSKSAIPVLQSEKPLQLRQRRNPGLLHRDDLARQEIGGRRLGIEGQRAQSARHGLPQLMVGRQNLGLPLTGKRYVRDQRAARPALTVQPRQSLLDRRRLRLRWLHTLSRHAPIRSRKENSTTEPRLFGIALCIVLSLSVPANSSHSITNGIGL